MPRLARLLRITVVLVLVCGLLGLVATGALYWYLVPQLPPASALRDVKLQVPLRVYSDDGALLAEFGEKRRIPLNLEHIPEIMQQAVLAAEDDRFYIHPGVDWQGLTRAVVYLLRTGEKGPGGSTITMQVARNFFLGREKTYLRKLNEILLALKIERELDKKQILELYLNKIFLGQRAYGVGAASQVYYGKPLGLLSLAQVAMIAGLPKAPSSDNPVANPKRAIERRRYVLGRMRELKFINAAEYELASKAPITARVHAQRTDTEAAYVAEMARALMEDRYGVASYTQGFKVYTTLHAKLQNAATLALRNALLAYDRRHGYRGAEQNGTLPGSRGELDGMLAAVPVSAGLRPALVLELKDQSARIYVKDQGEAEITWPGLQWARRYINENRRGRKPKKAADILTPGDLIRVQKSESGWRLAQIPEVQGAFVSLVPRDGRILALVGGFDFYRSKFNRVTQAERQPGSNFKPFIYSAALSYGFNPSSIINDAPVVFNDVSLEGDWRPENYSGKFFGPTRLREALYKSRNLVSIRLLRAIGIDYAVDYVSRFGFDRERLPQNLSLALGSATVKPIELVTGYAELANGGYKIKPYLIARVEKAEDGTVLYQANPLTVCEECNNTGSGDQPEAGASAPPAPADAAENLARVAPRILDRANVWLMHSLMRDVIRRGTGRRARVLKRKDLAGKTGTTNEQRDAWFSGFMPDIVATAWVGFDKLAPLGRRETGGRAALPMWIDYMRAALPDYPERYLPQPDNIISVRINPRTGEPADASQADAIFDYFIADRVPAEREKQNLADTTPKPDAGADGKASGGVTKQLF